MARAFGENKLSPLEIVDAREAQHKASELQRDLADNLAQAHRDVAAAEYAFRTALTARIKQLHDGGMAITMCEGYAKGEESIAKLRKIRDEKRGDLASIEQNAYRMGADRRSLDGLIDWSKHRDLRTDAPPAEGAVETFGARRAA